MKHRALALLLALAMVLALTACGGDNAAQTPSGTPSQSQPVPPS